MTRPRALLARYWKPALLALVWAAPLPLMQIGAVRSGVIAAAEWMRASGATAIAVYVAGYCVGAMFGMPTLLMSSIAGFAWGPIVGACIAVPAGATAASTTFLAARVVNFARPPEPPPAAPGEKSSRLVVLQRLLAHADFKTALLVRMAPMLPQNLISFAFAFSGVRLWQAFFATLIGHGPMTCLHVYVGSIVANADELVAGRAHLPGPPWLPYLFGLGSVATLTTGFVLLRAKVRAASAS